MRPPDFWSSRRMVSTLLLPAGCVYALATRRRLKRPGVKIGVPVVCVGNIGIGGAGKTPTALAVARLLHAQGRRPHFVSRGYRGREAGPLRVDPARHDFRAVGDEPLLLARAAPAWVARDRGAGALAAAAAGADCVVLDDGFQNPSPVKDFSIVVVDGGYGFGNQRVIPAGPLREPVKAGLARADLVVLIGEDKAEVEELCSQRPLLRARLAPDPVAASSFLGRRVVAFAGLGRPEKFFETLAALGASVEETIPFPDHHPYSESDLAQILDLAAKRDAAMVTTEKDHVRLPPSARRMVDVLPVRLEFEHETAMAQKLAKLFAEQG